MNKDLLMFKKITLQNNLNKNVVLKGSYIFNFINKVLNTEKQLLFKDLYKLIETEIVKAEQEEFCKEWGGYEHDKILFERLKQDILIEVQSKLEIFSKKNKLQ